MVGYNQPIIYNIEMDDSNKEYSKDLPTNAVKIDFQCREHVDIRYNWVSGQVADEDNEFYTLKAGLTKTLETAGITSETLYVACATTGNTLEIEVITGRGLSD